MNALKFTLLSSAGLVVYSIGLLKLEDHLEKSEEKIEPEEKIECTQEISEFTNHYTFTNYLELIFGSTLEEIVCRYPLVANNILYEIPCLLFTGFVGMVARYRLDKDKTFIPFTIISPVIGYGIDKLLKNTKYNNIGKSIFMSTSLISFAASHLPNYKHINTKTLAHVAVSQGVIGAVLTYTAINFGVSWSILSHILYNSSFFLIGKYQ